MGSTCAILGPNGSGKSTLIKLLTGSLSPSAGKISHQINDKKVDIEDVYTHMTIAAPYIELIEEFTLDEMIDFHFKFKSFLPEFNHELLIDTLSLHRARKKEIKYYSSGMKQRVKLALACCAESTIVFLDEPTSNLDANGEKWYLDLVEKTIHSTRTLIVGSNQEKEYDFCTERLNILTYKQVV